MNFKMHKININSNMVAYPNVSPSLLKEFTLEDMRDLSLLFESCDLKNRGYIDSKTLRAMFALLGFKASYTQTSSMLKDLDLNSNKLTFEDFLQCLVVKQGDSYDPYLEIKQSFQKVIGENRDSFDFDKLKEKSRELNLSLTTKELEDMLALADRNGDGRVDLNEYIGVIMQTNLFKYLK